MSSLTRTGLRRTSIATWLIAMVLTASPLAAVGVHAKSMEYVVFSIDGKIDGLALGQVLHEGERFEVPENTKIRLISKDGKIIDLSGPAAATVTKESENETGEEALSSISSRLFDDNRFIPVAGGTRSTGKETDLNEYLAGQKDNDAWVPVLSDADTYCARKDRLILRREKAADEYSLHINGTKSFIWHMGSYSLNLEKRIDRRQEQNPIEISFAERNIKIFVSHDDLPQLSQQVSWMAERGCKLQALKLLASGTSNADQ